jgi:hypothetical protein
VACDMDGSARLMLRLKRTAWATTGWASAAAADDDNDDDDDDDDVDFYDDDDDCGGAAAFSIISADSMLQGGSCGHCGQAKAWLLQGLVPLAAAAAAAVAAAAAAVHRSSNAVAAAVDCVREEWTHAFAMEG